MKPPADSVSADQKKLKASSLAFPLSIAAMVLAAGFAGAMLRPCVAPEGRAEDEDPASLGEGDLAVLLEHAAVDVRLGRGAAVVDTLGQLLPRVSEPATRARLLLLRAEAAVQAGQYAVAEEALRAREEMVDDARAKREIQMQRIGLLGAMKAADDAEALARAIIAGAEDPRVADEAQLRLIAATKTPAEIRAWVEAADTADAKEARRAGLAALELLSDAEEAARLLQAAAKGGETDLAVYAGLARAYGALARPADLAGVFESMDPLVTGDSERAEMYLTWARALVESGKTDAGLALVRQLLEAARTFEVRQAARQLRYRLLAQAGRLKEEIARLEERGDKAERAFVALAAEKDYALAEKLYGELSRNAPDSAGLHQQWKQAATKKELAERKALYAEVLRRDPGDANTIQKYLAVLVQLGESEEAGKLVRQLLEGKEKQPAALVEVAKLLLANGLVNDALELLKRAYEAEEDAGKKQQLLIILGDVYAQTNEVERARRLFTDLAATGATKELREQAMGRLSALR